MLHVPSQKQHYNKFFFLFLFVFSAVQKLKLLEMKIVDLIALHKII